MARDMQDNEIMELVGNNTVLKTLLLWRIEILNKNEYFKVNKNKVPGFKRSCRYPAPFQYE